MFFGMVVPAGILWHLSDGGFDVTQHAAAGMGDVRRGR